MSGSDVHDWSYYKKCMAGGILSCGITHALVCPLDIVKCRMQVSPGLYKGVGDGFSQIYKSEGLVGFSTVSIHFVFLSPLILYRVSSQPGLVTPSKDSVNSVSTRCSRMFTEAPWDLKRESRNIKLSVSPSHLHALRSLPIVSSAHGKQ
jgi:hypothetical protein